MKSIQPLVFMLSTHVCIFIKYKDTNIFIFYYSSITSAGIYLSLSKVGPRQMHEDENLLLVADDAGLAHRKHVGRHRRDGEAEGDAPLEVVLDDQLGMNLEAHELNDVLECVGGTVQQATKPEDGVGSVGRGHNLQYNSSFQSKK